MHRVVKIGELFCWKKTAEIFGTHFLAIFVKPAGGKDVKVTFWGTILIWVWVERVVGGESLLSFIW